MASALWCHIGSEAIRQRGKRCRKALSSAKHGADTRLGSPSPCEPPFGAIAGHVFGITPDGAEIPLPEAHLILFHQGQPVREAFTNAG